MWLVTKRIIIVTGHYGCGKTNLAVNLARKLNVEGRHVALCDLDIVNPYFRSADFARPLNSEGIETILPPFANTNLDVPTLTARVAAAVNDDSLTLVLDVGGDDAGAAALGQYSAAIARHGYDMLYLVNAYRFLTQTPEEALENLRDIEYASHLTATAIVNSSNLAGETTAGAIDATAGFAEDVSRLAGLPLYTVAERSLAGEISAAPETVFPVDRLVKLVWER